MQTSTLVPFIVLALASSTLSFAVAEEHQAPPGVAFEVQPVKTTYRTGEVVELNFTLRNLSKKDLLVARTFQLSYYVNLEILDQNGKRAAWCGRVVSQIDSARSFTTLPPGETVRRKVAVSCVDQNNPGRAWGYVLAAPGKYVIKATYRLPQPIAFFKKLFPGVPVVCGPVVAEAITVELQ